MLVHSIYYKLVMFFLLGFLPVILSCRPRDIKKQLENARKREEMFWEYRLSIIIYAFTIIIWGWYANLHIPQIINHEFVYTKGVVQSFEINSIEKDVIYYDEIVILKENEKIKFKGVDSPKLAKGDKVKIYEDIQYSDFVSEINGEDVLGEYDYKPITSKDSSIYMKLYYGIYMIILGSAQIGFYRKNRKGYELSKKNTNRFIFGKDIEKVGFKIWKIGFILYFILVVSAVVGLATSKLAGNLTVFFCWVYLVGFWLVYLGQCRSIVYYPDGVHIQETCGYIWNYTFDQIRDIRQIKESSYLIECTDGRTYPMSLCDIKQRKVISLMLQKIQIAKEERVLKDIAENDDFNPNIIKLQEMDVEKSQNYLVYKEKDRTDGTEGLIIIVGIIGLIAVIIVPFFVKGLSRWTIVAIFLVLIVLMTIWKKIRKKWDNLQDNVCQYARIEMHYKEEMEFKSVDGKVIKYTFYDEENIKDGDEFYIIYVSEIKKTFAENLETMKEYM